MTNKLMGLVVVAMLACGGEDDNTSCQEAVDNFYGVGCAFFDAQGNAFTKGEVLQNCKELLASAPPQCEDDLADLRSCLGGVANDQQCASCSDEQDAILTCE